MANKVYDFKATKREFKKCLISLEEKMETALEIDEGCKSIIILILVEKLATLMKNAKTMKQKTDNLQIEMEKKWEGLNPNDKASYQMKLSKFKDRY